ncbi:calcium-activated chloride channel regulator 1-like [Mixophyes fleayi]|uniref:calcium-activated chloride channel regulator 1-like n=1 Tax=Mixophyes fleayi TaxID=3061075 RepID=UPI003F4DE26F
MKIVGIFVLISIFQVTHSARDSLVKLKDNGYEDIVISISPKIPENAKLIGNIKKMVIDASVYMLQATENRLFIRSAKILIPNTWSSNSTFGRPKKESYDKADVIIADPLIDRDFPYTLQYGGCGEQGKYIHLTPNFILNDKVLRIFGPRGRVFVHEWAHLRWGVFDEYNNDIPFYLSNQGKVEATRCPLSMGGLNKIDVCIGSKCEKADCDVDSDTGLYEEGCEFYPNLDPNVHESVMYGQALTPVNAFCKGNTHNKEAPNQQNRLCNQQSTWEVIMKSADISQNAPLPDTNIPPPNFVLLQYKDRVVTLVLDVSGSMGGFDRISRMYQASEVYIMQIVESGSYVGIVTFSSDATVMTNLVKIVDTFQREKLKTFLPTVASGGTNICAGVRKGFEVNIGLDGNTQGTEIVLLTDGEDGGISSCFGEVAASGVIIHTLALGTSADKGLEQLSTMTGGLQLFASDKVDANGLIDSFSGIKSSSGDDIQQSIQIESTATTIKPNQCLAGKVTIDKTVGNDTFFLVTWSSSIPDIKLTDPNGKVYTKDQFVSDPISKSTRLMIPGTAERGDWEYNLCNTQPGDQVLGITVNSRAANSDVSPIVAEAYMNADSSSYPSPMIVYATVTQGLAPVVGVRVTAFIEPQNGKVITLQLLDNGAGADIIKNDGIYSRFYTDFNGNGRYNLKVRVENQDKDVQAAIPKSPALYLPGYVENGTIISNPPRPKVTSDNQNLGNFSRTSSGGAFVVSNVPETLTDIYKPSKITDLSAVIENQQVILSWTATGDDLDKGNASRYDLRMSLNSQMLLENFENGTAINISSLTPLPAGSREQFSFTPQNIAIKNGTVIYFTLVAIDEVNQKSEPSNLARAALFIPLPRPTMRPTIRPTQKPGNSCNSVFGTLYAFLLTIVAILTAY